MGLFRLYLALVVALGHYRMITMTPNGEGDENFMNYLMLGLDAGHAVYLFYIISGFLISYALEKKYNLISGGTIEFYKARFIRIYPLYWFVSAVALALAGTSIFADRKTVDVLLGVLLVGVDWRVAFGDYPNQDFAPFAPFLNQAWTLGAELTFYLLAPHLLKSTKLCIVVLCISAAIRGYLVDRYGFNNSWTYCFFPAALMFFLLGHLSRKIYAHLNFGHWNLLFIVPFVFCTWHGLGKPFDSVWFYGYVASMLIFMPQLFEVTKNIKMISFLGDSSYPLYLSHIIVLVLFGHYAMRGIEGVLMYGALCTVVGLSLHQLVDRPISFATKRLFNSKHLTSS